MPPSDDRPAGRAESIREFAESEPESVDVADLVDLLVYGDEETRRVASEAYDELASARASVPDAVARHLDSMLTASDTETRRGAVLATEVLVDRHPEAFASLRPRLEAIGSDLADPERERAVVSLSKLAIERPDLGAPAAETLVDMCRSKVDLGDDPEVEGLAAHPLEPTANRPVRDSPERKRRDVVRVHAVAGLTRIAAERPEVLAEHVPRIGRLLEFEDDHRLVQGGVCEVLEAMAETHPDSVEPFVPSVTALVAATDKRAVIWRAADALGAIGEHRPDAVGEAVASHASEFESYLDSSHAGLRGVGAGLLTYAAEADPSSVEPFVPTFRDLLADDSAPVRANAALALGLVGASDAREKIAELAADDPDEAVRTLAERALERFRHESAEPANGAS